MSTPTPPAARPRIAVVVNAGSGGGNDAAVEKRLRDLFDKAGCAADIRLAKGGAEIEAAVQAALDGTPDIVVAGGGDGTVNAVASKLVGGAVALGVLPLGTLNHFARDLGVPLDLDAAVAAIVTGRRIAVDVGEVNGRVFLNNSGLGLYPDIVRRRERQQRQLGRGKWLSFIWAALAALRRYPFLRVRLRIDGEERLRRTPFVFVGNNEYRMEGFAIGERTGLQDGRLSLYVAQRPGRLRLLQLALRALTGRLRQARDFDATLATEIEIESGHRRLRVSTDGEVTMMTPPLRYRIRAGALPVMVAQPPADAAAEADGNVRPVAADA